MNRVFVVAALLMLLIGARFSATRSPEASFWIGLDFYTAYGAARSFSAGHNPYDPSATDSFAEREGLPRIRGDILGGTPFWVWANELLLPFAPRTAAWIWFAISVAATLIGAAITEVVVCDALPPRPSRAFRLRIGIVAFLPMWGSAFIGQSSPMVFLMWALAAWLISRKASVAAACLCAVAGAIKVFPAGLLLWFALRREWRALGAGLLLLAVLQVPPSLIRPTILGEFIHAAGLFGSDAYGNALLVANQSLWAMVLRLFVALSWSVHSARMVFFGAACLWLGATAFAIGRSTQRNNLQRLAGLASVMIVVSACAPFLWHHSYVIVWPAYALALGARPQLGAICLALVGVQHIWDYVRIPTLVGSAGITSLALASAVLCWVALLRWSRADSA